MSLVLLVIEGITVELAVLIDDMGEKAGMLFFLRPLAAKKVNKCV